MEDSLVSLNKVEHIFLSKQFEEVCPFFISIGMTYDQFWKDDVTIATQYLKAYKLKMKRETEITEWNIWKQGMYIYEALCDVSPVLHAFCKKGTKPIPYQKEPYPLFKNKKDKKLSEEEAQVERDKAETYFRQWARNAAKKSKGG